MKGWLISLLVVAILALFLTAYNFFVQFVIWFVMSYYDGKFKKLDKPLAIALVIGLVVAVRYLLYRWCSI